MKLDIVINGKARSIEFDPERVDACEVEPGVYSILLDGRSYEVKVEPGAEGYIAGVEGMRYAIEVRDPRRLSRRAVSGAASGRQKVSSPMPGKVVRVLVQEGHEVAAGDGLLVVEAMKMQNEIRSPKAGRIVVVRTKEGAAVTGGEVLLEVE